MNANFPGNGCNHQQFSHSEARTWLLEKNKPKCQYKKHKTYDKIHLMLQSGCALATVDFDRPGQNGCL